MPAIGCACAFDSIRYDLCSLEIGTNRALCGHLSALLSTWWGATRKRGTSVPLEVMFWSWCFNWPDFYLPNLLLSYNFTYSKVGITPVFRKGTSLQSNTLLYFQNHSRLTILISLREKCLVHNRNVFQWCNIPYSSNWLPTYIFTFARCNFTQHCSATVQLVTACQTEEIAQLQASLIMTYPEIWVVMKIRDPETYRHPLRALRNVYNVTC